MFAQPSAGPASVSELFSTYQLGEAYDEMFDAERRSQAALRRAHADPGRHVGARAGAVTSPRPTARS